MRRRKTSARSLKRKSFQFISSHAQDARNRSSQPLPVLGFHIQLLAPRSRQTVEARAASEFRHAHFGLDPSLMFQSVKSRIERALIDLEHVFGYLLDAFGNIPAMLRSVLERAENQKIQSSLQKVQAAIFYHNVECLHQHSVECQQQRMMVNCVFNINVL